MTTERPMTDDELAAIKARCDDFVSPTPSAATLRLCVQLCTANGDRETLLAEVPRLRSVIQTVIDAHAGIETGHRPMFVAACEQALKGTP